jgi:hypothetical protein
MLLMLGALVLATCAGGVFVYVTRMPDPQTADLQGVLRWLVTRDLTQEPESTQEQLLSRLEGELRGGLELAGAGDQLTAEQRKRLIDNADVLGRRWFLKQVDQYAAQTAAERPKYLDRQIDEVERSGVVQALCAFAKEDNPRDLKSHWTSLTERITRWTARMEPQRKATVEQFVAAVQGNLLWRSLRANLFVAPPDSAGG